MKRWQIQKVMVQIKSSQEEVPEEEMQSQRQAAHKREPLLTPKRDPLRGSLSTEQAPKTQNKSW